MTGINSLLVDIKTLSRELPALLRKAGHNIEQTIGVENEYTISSLLAMIDGLVVKLLTMTAKRQQFLQQTAYAERKTIQTQLSLLLRCISESVELLKTGRIKGFSTPQELPLLEAPLFVDALKPYSRMIELIIAQERIHALSAVLENLLNREYKTDAPVEDCELTDEQTGALALSHYLVKQAL